MNRSANFNPVTCEKWFSAGQIKILHHGSVEGQLKYCSFMFASSKSEGKLLVCLSVQRGHFLVSDSTVMSECSKPQKLHQWQAFGCTS